MIISNSLLFHQIKPKLRSSNRFDATDEMDGYILLEGCGQISQWQFPKELKKCPYDNCGIQFAVRSDAIIHFQNRHAKHSIYCSICDMPIYAETIKKFRDHNEAKHPEVDVELNFQELLSQEDEVRSLSFFF